MQAVMDVLCTAIPKGLDEQARLGRAPRRRASDVLAFFDLPGASNGPTEATNGRPKHPRGSALGLRDLTHCMARSLLGAGGFRPRLHPGMR